MSGTERPIGLLNAPTAASHVGCLTIRR
jgi:hypothetical protein